MPKVCTSYHCTQPVYFRITQQYFKVRAHFMYTVVNGFQFGGFIDDVLRCSNLAAIMQQGCDVELSPLLFGGIDKLRQRPFRSIAGRFTQQGGQFSSTTNERTQKVM